MLSFEFFICQVNKIYFYNNYTNIVDRCLFADIQEFVRNVKNAMFCSSTEEEEVLLYTNQERRDVFYRQSNVEKSEGCVYTPTRYVRDHCVQAQAGDRAASEHVSHGWNDRRMDGQGDGLTDGLTD